MATRLMRRAATPLLAATLVTGGAYAGAVPESGGAVVHDARVAPATPATTSPTTSSAAGTSAAGPTMVLAATRTRTPLQRARRVVVRHTNRARASHSQPRLRRDRSLMRVAQRWSRRMAARTSMSHNPDVGSQIRPGWSTWAENVAYGYRHRTVVRAWMDSPGHRANILRDVTHIGVGMARGDDGHRYYTQVFATY